MNTVTIDLDECRETGLLPVIAKRTADHLRSEGMSENEIQCLLAQIMKLPVEPIKEIIEKYAVDSPVSQWQPAPVTIDLLQKIDIPFEFIESELAVLQKDIAKVSDKRNEWFVKTIKARWVRERARLAKKALPALLSPDWMPADDVYVILAKEGISREYAESLIPTFKLYWIEAAKTSNTWDSKFNNYVQFQWQKMISAIKHNGQRSTKDVSLNEMLNDHSWV